MQPYLPSTILVGQFFGQSVRGLNVGHLHWHLMQPPSFTNSAVQSSSLGQFAGGQAKNKMFSDILNRAQKAFSSKTQNKIDFANIGPTTLMQMSQTFLRRGSDSQHSHYTFTAEIETCYFMFGAE